MTYTCIMWYEYMKQYLAATSSILKLRPRAFEYNIRRLITIPLLSFVRNRYNDATWLLSSRFALPLLLYCCFHSIPTNHKFKMCHQRNWRNKAVSNIFRFRLLFQFLVSCTLHKQYIHELEVDFAISAVRSKSIIFYYISCVIDIKLCQSKECVDFYGIFMKTPETLLKPLPQTLRSFESVYV